MTSRAEFFPELIQRLIASGMTLKTIARKVGVAHSTVFLWREGTSQPRYWHGVDLVKLDEERK